MKKLTIKNKYQLTLTNDVFDNLYDAKLFLKVDLKSGYHQIRVKKSYIRRIAFVWWLRHYEYVVVAFQLINT